jgi:hypothetical protein
VLHDSHPRRATPSAQHYRRVARPGHEGPHYWPTAGAGAYAEADFEEEYRAVFRFDQHPAYPECGGRRTSSTFYGMPSDVGNIAPWLHIGGFRREPITIEVRPLPPQQWT